MCQRPKTEDPEVTSVLVGVFQDLTLFLWFGPHKQDNKPLTICKEFRGKVRGSNHQSRNGTTVEQVVRPTTGCVSDGLPVGERGQEGTEGPEITLLIFHYLEVRRKRRRLEGKGKSQGSKEKTINRGRSPCEVSVGL